MILCMVYQVLLYIKLKVVIGGERESFHYEIIVLYLILCLLVDLCPIKTDVLSVIKYLLEFS